MGKFFQFGILFMLIFSGLNDALANDSNDPNSFFLHMDKPYYITGEIIWYKLYIPSSNVKKNVAIKGLLLNPEGKVVERFFHKSEGKNYVAGFLKTPYNFKSGVYRLVFKSNLVQSNKEIILAESTIPLYNDLDPTMYDPKLKDKASGNDNNNSAAPLNSNLNIDIKIDNSSVKPRSAIGASITITDASGQNVSADYSLSVVDKSVFAPGINPFGHLAQGGNLQEGEINGLPEKLYLKGVVMDSSNIPFKANVLGAYASKQNRIHYTKSNGDGLFTLPLPDFYNQQSLQFLGYEKEKSEINIEIVQDAPSADNQGNRNLILNDQIVNYLKNSQKRKKLSQYYENLIPQIDLQNYVDEFQELKPDFSYDVKEYVKFDRFVDFFDELITPLTFKKVKGVYLASMRDPTVQLAVQGKLNGNPLFIIDGKATRNANFIAQVSMSNIETIELFYVPAKLRKQFNILGLSGVVKINTIIPQFDLPEKDKEDLFVVDGIQQKGSFVGFSPNPAEGKVPNFFNTLYWNPDLETNNKGTSTVQFYHPDNKGTFEIIVVAQDKKGNRGIASVQYNVP